MRTFFANADTVSRDWLVVNADSKVLGRLASEIACRLRGKHKPEYTPHVDTGDYVIVINAEKIRVTGSKESQKRYYTHTGRPGSLKEYALSNVRHSHPERIIHHAVRGMLPRTRLGRAMLAKLHVYAGPEHRHQAQKPKPIDL